MEFLWQWTPIRLVHKHFLKNGSCPKFDPQHWKNKKDKKESLASLGDIFKTGIIIGTLLLLFKIFVCVPLHTRVGVEARGAVDLVSGISGCLPRLPG